MIWQIDRVAERKAPDRTLRATSTDDELRPAGHKVEDLIKKYEAFAERREPEPGRRKRLRINPYICLADPEKRLRARDVAAMTGVKFKSIANIERNFIRRGMDHFVIRGVAFKRVAWIRPDCAVRELADKWESFVAPAQKAP